MAGRGFTVFFITIALAAQQSSSPKFDVVSIREVPPNTPPTLREIGFTAVLPGGQYVDSRTSLFSMIAFAYNVKNASVQLVGLPRWAQNTSYSVAAKADSGSPALPPAENYEKVRLMVRAMLADRFGLKLHTETRQEAVYHLEVAKGGIKIKEVDPPVPPAKAAPVGTRIGNNGGRLIGSKSTIGGIASTLTVHLRRPLVDQTGLKGYYDFDIQWSAPEVEPSSPGFGPEGISLLFSTLKDRFGLNVTSATGPVEYWVVDQVVPPSEN